MEQIVLNEEKELLQRLSEADEQAFIQVYKRHYMAVLLYAERITNNDFSIAEEATADAFIELWKGRRSFGNVAQLISYLRVIVHHKCIDRYRQFRKQQALESELLYLSEHQQEALFSGEISLEAELLKKIREEVEKLPAHIKEVFNLACIQGRRNSEIARILNIKDATVRRRKTEALHYLRQAFKGMDWSMLSLWLVFELHYFKDIDLF
ncbi:RNA polymerase sigma factor [Chitinophaga sp. MM2321]|uniref:RNA polymerase sigma factor n=1 Tax=Chitinophaga sp. MM2321 TaxID=3137178 RepID=UPI0032D59943